VAITKEDAATLVYGDKDASETAIVVPLIT